MTRASYSNRRFSMMLLASGVLASLTSAGALLYGQSLYQPPQGGATQQRLSQPQRQRRPADAASLGQIPSLDGAASALRPLATSPQSNGTSPAIPVIPAVQEEDLTARLAELTPEEQIAVKLYAERNKSVVNVSTFETHNSFFQQRVSEGCGSGVVLNKQGVILTNFHVVENTSKMTVTLFNGETYDATTIAVDPNTDCAVIKINAPADQLFPVDFGDSSKLLVGQTVYAIGNPFGLERTMTKGIISNLNRSIDSPQQFRQIKGVIQIDAAINPGNSGGALFDTKGRMIGMNTAIASHVGENSGVGFAVPVNTIHRIVSILLERGEVVRGDAGVVQVTETENGLIPTLIDEGGAADLAGLRGGKVVITIRHYNGQQIREQRQVRPEGGYDLIVGVNDQQVRTGEEFITAVEEHESGETITLHVLRGGREIELPVVLK